MRTVVSLKHYEQGSPDAPSVLLAPSLGTRLAMWDHLAEDLADDFRVIRFDTRGHGASPAPEGPYTVAELADDVVALADELEIGRFAFVGISMGGAIGQTLALDHPERLTALVLCCTGPSFGDPETWRERAARVRSEGMEWLDGPTRERWFTPGFRASDPRTVDELVGMLTDTNPVGYAACCDALAGYDVTPELGRITVPTRVVAASEDPVSGPEAARALVDGIPGSDLVMLDGVSHLANVAAPEAFDAAVREHLERHS
ncbi:MAG: 3-oxoadipate enol-lactonase [Nocardioides sp.]